MTKKQSVLDRYVEICVKEKELAAEKLALKDAVLNDMDSDGLKNYIGPLGTLTITRQNRWTYTKDAKAEKKTVIQELERKFIKEGRAELKEIRFPQFWAVGQDPYNEE